MKENAVRNCSGVLCLCGCAGAPQVAICRGAWPGTVRRCVSDVLVLECVRKGVRYHPVLFGCVRKWYPPHQCVCHCRNQRYTHVTNHTDDNHTHTPQELRAPTNRGTPMSPLASPSPSARRSDLAAPRATRVAMSCQCNDVRACRLRELAMRRGTCRATHFPCASMSPYHTRKRDLPPI
jgi:hypothetical protein